MIALNVLKKKNKQFSLTREFDRYPRGVTPDFRQCSSSTLQRYVDMYKLEAPNEGHVPELANIVANHFQSELDATEAEILPNFVEYVMNYNGGNSLKKINQENKRQTRPRKRKDLDDEAADAARFKKKKQLIKKEKEKAAALASAATEDNTSQATDEPADEREDKRRKTDKGVDKKKRGGRGGKAATAKEKKEKATKGKGKVAKGGRGKESGRGGRKKGDSKQQPLYCVCKSVSYGKMIGCDNATCKIEWFHIGCVDVNVGKIGDEWYCPTCYKAKIGQSTATTTRAGRTAGRKQDTPSYFEMIEASFEKMPNQQGTYGELCKQIETDYKDILNWKTESKTPVWKASVRKVLCQTDKFYKVDEELQIYARVGK